MPMQTQIAIIFNELKFILYCQFFWLTLHNKNSQIKCNQLSGIKITIGISKYKIYFPYSQIGNE